LRAVCRPAAHVRPAAGVAALVKSTTAVVSKGMHPLDSSPLPISYRSGPVEVRLATREFFRHGIRMPVQPKVFDLIVFLIEQRARVVDKDELQDVIWPR
jgi:DNA-binding response OmpR family regulator